MGLVAATQPGCETLTCCPLPEPIARRALRADLVGTWRASIQYNETTPWTSTQREPLVSDTFLTFDPNGDLQYVGLIAPGDAAGVWQIDFVASAASAAFRIVRGGLLLDYADRMSSTVTDDEASETPGDPNDPNTPGATVDYALRASQGFGVVGFDLTWRVEDLRVDATGQFLTGVLTQTERELASPVPTTTTFGGTVWLKRVDLDVQAPAGAIVPESRLTARSGGQIPHPVGTVFDLDASGTTGPTGFVVEWTVQRKAVDEFGRFVSGAVVEVPSGATSSFTAEAAGTYLVRCWVTDGVQWATDFPLATRVE